jgi:uncharacterized membrane protein
MINNFLLLILLTLIPFLELRYSIPAGILSGSIALPFGFSLIGLGMQWHYVFFICVITNFILGIVIFLLLRTIVNYLRKLKWFDKLYRKIIARPQKKIKKYVEKYGELGVAIFISIPLPGSGVYTGALGAYAIGLKFKKFVIADLIGVTIAGIIVTILTLTSRGIFT